MGLKQPFILSETVTLSTTWQRVPQAWSSSRKTPVTKTVIWTSDNAHRCVGRSESARADVGIEPTVVCQIRRCLDSQTLKTRTAILQYPEPTSFFSLTLLGQEASVRLIAKHTPIAEALLDWAQCITELW